MKNTQSIAQATPTKGRLSGDEILNLKILLHTTQDVKEFLSQLK